MCCGLLKTLCCGMSISLLIVKGKPFELCLEFTFFPSRAFLEHNLALLTKFWITPLQATGQRPVNYASHTKLFIPTIFHTLSLSLCPKFLLTQFLTNHSTFSSYLHKINRRPHQIATVHKRLYRQPVTLWQNAAYSQRTDQQYTNLFPHLSFWSTT